MSATYKLMTMTCGAAGAQFTPIAFSADEAISAPFLLHIDAVSPRGDLQASDLLHQSVTLTVNDSNGAARYFNGLVRQMSVLGQTLRGQWRYDLDVVPKFWFLMQTSDCRVFPHKTVEEILTALFQDGSVSPVDFRIYGPKRVREYTAQVNETDLVFASRLLQEEGWFYFFEHSATAHTLVISDKNQGFHKLANDMSYHPALIGASRLMTWCPADATAYGEICLKDYDPVVPDAPLQSTQTVKDPVAVAGALQRDVFRWPALSFSQDEVDSRTRLMIEAAEAQATLVEGNGWNPAFMPGARFTLQNDPDSGAGGQAYVLRGVVHRGLDDQQFNAAAKPVYSNSFTAFPAATPWRDRLTIRRPSVPGVFSATVIGPAGQDIETDGLGRVKIRFKWDRRGDSVNDSALWVRVMMPWAGSQWGAQFIPRIGTEVAVTFMDGDVDRPVITGCLYNGNAKPPFLVPGQKTLSGIETRSTPVPKDAQGNPAGAVRFHLLRFDDAAGNEQFLLRSQARMDVTAKSSLFETVGVGDRHQTVISGYDKVTNTTVNGNSFVTIGYPHFGVPPFGNYDLHVGGSRFEKVDGPDYGYQLTVKKDFLVSVEENCSAAVQQDFTLNAKNIVLEASQKITLKVGSSTIVLNAGGVYLDGAMIYKQGNGPADSTSDLTFQDVLDAVQADAGDPPGKRQGGGGPGSAARGSHVVPAQHAPESGVDEDGMLSTDMGDWSGDSG